MSQCSIKFVEAGFTRSRGPWWVARSSSMWLSRPKRVIINGSVSDYETALNILCGEAGRTLSTKETDLRDRSICYTAETEAIRTKCGHTYCLDCFENLCMSTTKEDRPAEVKCAGNLGQCGISLNLPELQEHLSPSAFEELLKNSFLRFIRTMSSDPVEILPHGRLRLRVPRRCRL